MESMDTKFNGDGFFTWQSKTMYLLMRKGLWHLIEDDDLKMEPLDNHKALGLIAQSLGDDVISHIAGIMDAKEAWLELNRVFGTESKSSKINLLMQFYKLDKKESETMVQHISKFKGIKQQLSALKKVIEEDESMAVLLKSVDKEPYESIVATLKNVPNIKLQDIESSLLEHESKVKEKGSFVASQSGEQALFTRSGKFQRNNQQTPRCFHCGKLGHTKNECRNKDKPKLVCDYCQKVGHLEDQCYHKKNQQQANFIEVKSISEHNKEQLF